MFNFSFPQNYLLDDFKQVLVDTFLIPKNGVDSFWNFVSQLKNFSGTSFLEDSVKRLKWS